MPSPKMHRIPPHSRSVAACRAIADTTGCAETVSAIVLVSLRETNRMHGGVPQIWVSEAGPVVTRLLPCAAAGAFPAEAVDLHADVSRTTRASRAAARETF